MHGHRWSATHQNDSRVWTWSGLLLRVVGICGCASDKIPIETFSAPKILGFRFVFCAQEDGTILKPLRTKVALCLFGANIYYLTLNLFNGSCALNFGVWKFVSQKTQNKTVCRYFSFFSLKLRPKVCCPYWIAFYKQCTWLICGCCGRLSLCNFCTSGFPWGIKLIASKFNVIKKH